MESSFYQMCRVPKIRLPLSRNIILLSLEGIPLKGITLFFEPGCHAVTIVQGANREGGGGALITMSSNRFPQSVTYLLRE